MQHNAVTGISGILSLWSILAAKILHFLNKIRLVDLAIFRKGTVGTININFIQDIISVPARVPIKQGIDTVNQQTRSGD